jgi:hypothetical protein
VEGWVFQEGSELIREILLEKALVGSMDRITKRHTGRIKVQAGIYLFMAFWVYWLT